MNDSYKNVQWYKGNPLIYNTDYIMRNIIADEVFEKAGYKLYPQEFFVRLQAPYFYAVSTWGRVVKLKGDNEFDYEVTQYDYIADNGKTYKTVQIKLNKKKYHSTTVNNLVGNIFCTPDEYKLELGLDSHHIDEDTTNNHYLNIICYPKTIHTGTIHRLGNMKLYNEELDFWERVSTYHLIAMTGMSIDDIVDTATKAVSAKGGQEIFIYTDDAGKEYRLWFSKKHKKQKDNVVYTDADGNKFTIDAEGNRIGA